MLIFDALLQYRFGQCCLRFDSCWMVAHKRTEAGGVRSVFRSDPAEEKQIGRENDRCVLACLGRDSSAGFYAVYPALPPASIPDWACLRYCRL